MRKPGFNPDPLEQTGKKSGRITGEQLPGQENLSGLKWW